LRWLVLTVALISPALADEPDGPGDVRPTPPQSETPPPPALPPPPAPPPPLPPMLAPQSPQQYAAERSTEAEKLERSGKAMKAGGAFMIALGAALELTGLSMSLYSQFGPGPTCYILVQGGKNQEVCGDDPRTPYLIAGTVSEIVGGALIGGGMPVMFAGISRIRRAKVMKLHMSFGPQEVRAQAAFTF
jgi:hypothetical protein